MRTADVPSSENYGTQNAKEKITPILVLQFGEDVKPFSFMVNGLYSCKLRLGITESGNLGSKWLQDPDHDLNSLVLW